MNATPSLFDPPEGRKRRDRGMAQTLLKLNYEWGQWFEAAVESQMRHDVEFTADDIIAIVGMPPGNPNSIGALMRSLATRGVIVDTGKTRKAKRAASHARRQTVWRGAAT